MSCGLSQISFTQTVAVGRQANPTTLKHLILLVQVAHLSEAAFEFFGQGFESARIQLGLGVFNREQRFTGAQSDLRHAPVEHHAVEGVIHRFELGVGHIVTIKRGGQ